MPSGLKRLWWRWKSLRLPWRKKWFVGFDLNGNSFWQFKDALNANRLRRIVHYSKKVEYADVKLSPSWVQWLRHTRYEAPTINEQQLDVKRQAQIRQLAAQADARWAAAQASYLQVPTPAPALEAGAIDSTAQEDIVSREENVLRKLVTKSEENIQEAAEELQNTSKPRRTKKEVKWEELRLSKNSNEPQPESWTPKPVKRG